MAAHAPASGWQELHHRVPRCLLRLRDRADAHPELDGEGLQLWLDYELEALHHGIDPDISREELTALIEGSTVVLPAKSTGLATRVISCGGVVGVVGLPL